MIKPQLFMLHFAGGNCYSFNFIKPLLDTHFEVHLLELPGRGKRMAEPLLGNREEAVVDYVNQIIQKHNDEPILIYGHSMGAHLGISVAKYLEDKGVEIAGVIFSGNAGPGVAEIKNCYLMSDVDFKNHLMQLGGISEEVLEHPELFEFFAPIIRKDFEILEKEGDPFLDIKVNAPINVLMGSNEKYVDHILNWENYSSKKVETHILEGDHFFIHDKAKEVVKIILKAHDNSLVY